MFKKLTSMLGFGKKEYFGKLIARDNNFSSKAWALIVVVLLAVMMIAILAAGMIVDLIYNHTFTMSLSDVAMLIGSLSTMIFSIALPKSMCDKNQNGIPDDQEDCNECGE